MKLPQLSFDRFPFDRIAFIVGVIDSLTAYYSTNH
jgi:hypothetical protein